MEDFVGRINIDVVCFNYDMPKSKIFDIGKDLELNMIKLFMEYKN